MDIGYILQYGVQYIEAVAFVCSLIYFKKYFNTISKLIPLYLGIVFCVEFAGESMAFDHWLYNLLGIIEYLIFTFIFYNTIEDRKLKKIILLTFIGGVLALLIDTFFLTKTFNTFLASAFGFVSLGTSIMCFVFLFELARTEKVMYQNRILLYWVVIGLLFFHLCNLPVTVLMNDLFKIGNVNNILMIQSVAAIAMYVFYIIGFIWSKKEYNY